MNEQNDIEYDCLPRLIFARTDRISPIVTVTDPWALTRAQIRAHIFCHIFVFILKKYTTLL